MPAHDTCTHDTDNPRAYYTYKSRAHERAAPARPPHTHRPSLPPAWPPHTHLRPGRRPRCAAACRRRHAAVVAAAGLAIAAVAAAAAELLAKAAPIVDEPPVASLVRRTDRPMKDEPTAQWSPAGLGTEVTFPPDT